MKRTVTRTGLMAAAALGALLAGCTHSDKTPTTLPSSAAPAPASASPSASPSATAVTPDQAKRYAIDAYLGFQTAFQKAGAAGDPEFPDLAKYGTGDALKLFTNGLKSAKTQGLLSRGKAVFHPKIASLSPPAAPTKVSVQDCMDTSKTERYKVDGSPYKDSPGGMRLVLADVERIGDEWKVTGIGIREVGSCKL
ncbi:hypothetical protein O7630_10445 [Micromonospora sp. WMMD718]|uniref:hypothetical protein n=1 Tax=Micromonospora TaxID=1873 RepID=UPI00064B8534|nr:MULTISPECIES: hypothetical protein [unclassified Micromonospora]MDG4751361.1 hypothetical protein [Micromonospora sp. WMMD718]